MRSWTACLLLALCARPDAASQGSMPPLCAAAWRGDLAEAERLIEHGAPLDQVYQDQTPLMWAAKMGHAEVVALLIRRGADVQDERKGWTALRWAAAGGETAIVAELLRAGADPLASPGDVYGTVLHLAALHDDGELIATLARGGAPVDEPSKYPGGTPLHVAALDGNAESARALLRLGASTSSVGALGRTPLHVACIGGHVRVVRDLLAAGADPAARDELGLTPLHLAAIEGHERAVVILRGARGTDPAALRGARDARGWTPAHYAAAFGHSRCLAGLIGWNESPDPRNDSGSTPLHWACASGDADTIALLLARGADPAATDVAGKTPIERWAASLPPLFSASAIAAPDADAPALDVVARSAEDPIVVVYRTPGYTVFPVSGLVLAIWSDGVVLAPSDPAAPGEDLRVGRIAAEEAADLTARLAEIGFFDLPDTHEVGMHAPSVRIRAVHDGEVRRHEWDEIVADWETWYPDSAKRTFEAIQLLARRCIASVRPERTEPLAQHARDGAFRGYELDRPLETPWLR